MTRDCNLHCPHCYEGHDPYWKGKRIDHEKFKTLLDTYIYQRCVLSDNANAHINFHFHGGEVLLIDTKELKKDIEYIKKRREFFPNIDISFQSNGVNLTDELADYLASNGIYFGFSFDGYDNQRMSRSETEKLVKRLRYFHNTFGLRMGCLGVLSKRNIKYWIEDAKTLSDFVEGFGINVLASMNDAEIPTAAELWDYWAYPTLSSLLTDDKFSERTINIYVNNILNQIIFGYIPIQEKTGCFDRVCGFGTNMTAINPDFELGTCDKYLNDGKYTKEKEYKVSLNQLDFLAVQQVNMVFKHYSRLFEISKKQGCTFCPMKWACTGECQSYSLSKYGELKLNESLCEVYKKIYAFIVDNWMDLAKNNWYRMPVSESNCKDVLCTTRDLLNRNNLRLEIINNNYKLVEKEK